MDFIETVFGLAPDNGSGSFELVLLLMFALMLPVPVIAFLRNRWARQRNHRAMRWSRVVAKPR